MSLIDFVVWWRLVERGLLDIVFLVFMFLLTYAFWTSVQKVKLAGTKAPEVTAYIATPILMLMMLVGYAYVSFSNPLTASSVTRTAAGAATECTDIFAGFTENPCLTEPRTDAVAAAVAGDLQRYFDGLVDAQGGPISAEQAKTSLGSALQAVCLDAYGQGARVAPWANTLAQSSSERIQAILLDGLSAIHPTDPLCTTVVEKLP